MKLFSAARFKTPEWAVFLLASVVLAALLYADSHNDEAKPPPPSLEDYFRHGDTNGFKRMGPKGIRFLTDELGNKAHAERSAAVFDRLPFGLKRWIAPHFWREWEYERAPEAAGLLCVLGPDAAPAVPAVLKILEDPASDWELKQECAEILGAIGPKAKPAIFALLAVTTNNNSAAQVAAMALWKIARQTNAVVEVISNRLRFAGGERRAVLPYFESLGPALVPAEPVIENALFDEDYWVRVNAERILKTIEPNRLRKHIEESNREASCLLLTHIEGLQSKNYMERVNALNAIAVFGPAATNAVPALVLMFESLEGQTEPDHPDRLPSRARYERTLCLEAVAEIGPAAYPTTPALVRLLHPHGDYVLNQFEYADVGAVCRSLSRIGPGAAEAIPALKELLANSMGWNVHRLPLRNRVVAVAVGTALSQISPDDPAALAAQRTLQTNDVRSNDTFATVALWRMGLETNLPIEELTAKATLKTNGASQRHGMLDLEYYWANEGPRMEPAIDLLGDIGPAARRALPALEEHLDPIDPLRRNAAIAIRKIDPEAAERLGLPGLLILAPK